MLQEFFLIEKDDNNLTFHGSRKLLKVKRPFASRLRIMISFVIMWSAQATLKTCRISSSLMFLHQCNRSEYSIDIWPSGSLISTDFTRRESNVLCISKYSSFSMIENGITYSVEDSDILLFSFVAT